MMARAKSRVQDCSRADAMVRLKHAELYLTLAETVSSTDTNEEATVATGNAVLAAIAAADAICCAVSNGRHRGQDHAGAADHLEMVTGDKQLAMTFREIVNLKDAGHYGLDNIAASRAKSVIRKARRLVDEAERRIR